MDLEVSTSRRSIIDRGSHAKRKCRKLKTIQFPGHTGAVHVRTLRWRVRRSRSASVTPASEPQVIGAEPAPTRVRVWRC